MDVYLDNWGLPVTKSMDGGDSAHEAGTLMALDPQHCKFDIKLYIQEFGPVRHPDHNKWYGRPGRFSRDALIALQCGLIMHPNYYQEKMKLYKLHKKNWFIKAWNPIRNFVYEDSREHAEKSTPDVAWRPEHKTIDPTGPETWALWIRMFWKEYGEGRLILAWLLLNILDLETLVGAIHWNWKKNNLSRNHLLVTLVSTSTMPTITSWLARWITPVDKLIMKWDAHTKATSSIVPTELFKAAFKR